MRTRGAELNAAASITGKIWEFQLHTTGCWRLYGGAWQLLAVVQRVAEGLASLSPPATPRAARPPEAATTPSSAHIGEQSLA